MALSTCSCLCPAVSLPFNTCFLRPRCGLLPPPGRLPPLCPPGELLLILQAPGQALAAMTVTPASPASPLVTVLKAAAIWAPVHLPCQTRTPLRAGLTHFGVHNTAQPRTSGPSAHGCPRGPDLPPPFRPLLLLFPPAGDLFFPTSKLLLLFKVPAHTSRPL